MDSLNCRHESYNYILYEVRCSKYHENESYRCRNINSLILFGLWDYFLLNIGSKRYVVVGKYAYVTTLASKYTGW